MRAAILALLCFCALVVQASASTQATAARCTPDATLFHGGGLNACGCHFNRRTGECHCHQPRGCGCACQPPGCP